MRRAIITVLLGLVIAGGLTARPADAQATESRYLSGTDKDHTVPWEFMVSDGRRKGEWTTIPVPSNWELHGFGTHTYGQEKNKAVEEGRYRHRFDVPAAWKDRRVFLIFEGSMTDTEIPRDDLSASGGGCCADRPTSPAASSTPPARRRHRASRRRSLSSPREARRQGP